MEYTVQYLEYYSLMVYRAVAVNFLTSSCVLKMLKVNLNFDRFTLRCLSQDKFGNIFPPSVLEIHERSDVNGLALCEFKHWWSQPKCYCCCELKTPFLLEPITNVHINSIFSTFFLNQVHSKMLFLCQTTCVHNRLFLHVSSIHVKMLIDEKWGKSPS